MTWTSILTMALIIGFVMGGFFYFLSMAIRKEAGKKKKDALA